VTVDGAIELIVGALFAWGKVAGPLLVAALAVGVLVGVLQAATQVNEASISFLMKLAAMGLTVLALGSWTMRMLVEYTEQTLASISEVTR
jgi:flagellar biosynthetic protein FliQ